MKPEDAEEYTQALGQVVAGGWRQIALGQRLGVPTALGLTVEDWVSQRLGGYVRLSVPERRQAVAELKAGNQNIPNTDIAAVLGVTETTIRRDLESTNVDRGVESPSKPDDESTNVEPQLPTSEQWTDLEQVRERAKQIDQLRADHPERFAADEIFEVLAYAFDVTETWMNKTGVDAEPGTKSRTEWDALINRLHAVTDFVRRFHESNRQAYATQ